MTQDRLAPNLFDALVGIQAGSRNIALSMAGIPRNHRLLFGIFGCQKLSNLQ
jgi:hypothetical protein